MAASSLSRLVHGLHFKNLRGDFFGGLTAAIVALPLALAFGVSSGAGPTAGLYGAICIGFFAALFGWMIVTLTSTIASWYIGPKGRYKVLIIEKRR